MRLYSLPLASSQYDYAHRVLALLYCTSRGAALSGGAGPLPPSLLLERLEREAERAILGEPSYLTDTSSTSGSWAEVPWSPASELSEWSDGGAAEAVATAPAAGEQQQPQTMMDGEAAGVDGGAAMDVDAQRQQQQQQQRAEAELPAPPALSSLAVPPKLLVGYQAQAATLASAPPGSARSPYERSSLAVWLASRRSGGHPQRLLEPRLCFTEQELVAQVGSRSQQWERGEGG